MGRYTPRCRDDREYESDLSNVRIRKGITVKDLCKLAGISTSGYYNLNSGETPPIDVYNGSIKPSAIRIANYLGAELHELWPRYFCAFDSNELMSDEEKIELIHGSMQSSYFDDPEYIYLEKERISLLNSILQSRLTKREYFIIVSIHINEMSLKEISDYFNISRERVRQIEVSVLKRLRHNNTKHVLRAVLDKTNKEYWCPFVY